MMPALYWVLNRGQVAKVALFTLLLATSWLI
jgi:hypothetical protein